MASMTPERVATLGAALSIDVEDWFHTDNLRDVITRQAWENWELRVERNTMRMLPVVGSRRAHDPALWNALLLLYPFVGDRSRAAAGRRDQGDLVSPARQPASLRGALRCADRRFRVDAGLRSHRWVERGSRYWQRGCSAGSGQ